MGWRIVIALIFSFLLLFQLEASKPLDCVAEASNLWIYSHEGIREIPQYEWDLWLTLNGESMWIGDENGHWDIPEDTHGYVNDITIYGIQDGEIIQVWIRYSESTEHYYLLSFDNMIPHTDENNENYGIHPCGGWEIDKKKIDFLIDSERELIHDILKSRGETS